MLYPVFPSLSFQTCYLDLSGARGETQQHVEVGKLQREEGDLGACDPARSPPGMSQVTSWYATTFGAPVSVPGWLFSGAAGYTHRCPPPPHPPGTCHVLPGPPCIDPRPRERLLQTRSPLAANKTQLWNYSSALKKYIIFIIKNNITMLQKN